MTIHYVSEVRGVNNRLLLRKLGVPAVGFSVTKSFNEEQGNSNNTLTQGKKVLIKTYHLVIKPEQRLVKVGVTNR